MANVKFLSSRSSQPNPLQISISLDGVLQNKIETIKVNRKKRTTRVDLMGERDDLKEVQVDNALVKCYVNCVSDTYSIADPFQFADSETTLTKTRKTKVEDYQGRHNEYEHTPIKSLQMKQPQTPSSTKKKVIIRRDPFKRDNSLPNTAKKDDIMLSKPLKQIGYRTTKRIQFKNAHKERQLINEVRNKQLDNLPPMAETFRYCPMCEELVLDCNIRHHESECSFIKEAYQMPEHKLRQILENKINRLKAQIRQTITSQKYNSANLLSNIHSHTNEWLDSVKLDNQNHQIPDFSPVRTAYKQVLHDTYDKSYKMNWFLQIRANLLRNMRHQWISNT